MEKFLKEHPFNGSQRDVASVLDYLTVCYLEEYPISSERVKEIQDKMAPYYEGVPFAVSEQLFQLVYDLCGAYEDAAFREGLKVGLHLGNEIRTII